MPYNSLNKTAGIKAKSLEDLTSILSQTGKKFNVGEKAVDAAEAVKHMYTKGGSGSFVYDTLSAIPKKVLKFGGKKVSEINPKTGKEVVKKIDTVGEKIKGAMDSAIHKYQKHLTNADIKAGNFVTEHTPFKKSFVSKETFRVADDIAGKPGQILEVNVPRLSKPIDSVKDKVLPTVGAFTVSSKMQEMADKKKQKNNQTGEGGVAMKSALSREQLIEKIAAFAKENDIQLVVPDPAENQQKYDKLATLANKAVEMLKEASAYGKNADEKANKLAEDKKKLELQLMAKNRSDRAVKLAYDMNERGLVKKADIDSKIDEIMDMNDDAFQILAETVSKMAISKTAASEGVDSLSYISSGSDSDEARKKTLEDEIDNAVHGR
jgi:hypothetical protein